MCQLFWDYRITGDPPEEEKPLIGNHSSCDLEAVKLYADVGMVEVASYTSGKAEGKPLSMSSCLTDDIQEETDLTRPKDFPVNCKTSQRG